MKKEIAEKWASDVYDYYINNFILTSYNTLGFWGRKYNRYKKFMYVLYLRYVFKTHLWLVSRLERMTRFNKGDLTYKNFK